MHENKRQMINFEIPLPLKIISGALAVFNNRGSAKVATCTAMYGEISSLKLLLPTKKTTIRKRGKTRRITQWTWIKIVSSSYSLEA